MWMRAIKVLYENQKDNVSHLAKKVDCTYSHLTKIFNHLEEIKLIKTSKVGRCVKTEFTLKGMEVAKSLDIIFINVLDEKQISKSRKYYIQQQNNNSNVPSFVDIPKNEKEYTGEEK